MSNPTEGMERLVTLEIGGMICISNADADLLAAKLHELEFGNDADTRFEDALDAFDAIRDAAHPGEVEVLTVQSTYDCCDELLEWLRQQRFEWRLTVIEQIDGNIGACGEGDIWRSGVEDPESCDRDGLLMISWERALRRINSNGIGEPGELEQLTEELAPFHEPLPPLTIA